MRSWEAYNKVHSIEVDLREKHLRGEIDDITFKNSLMDLTKRYIAIGELFPAVLLLQEAQAYEKLREVGNLAICTGDTSAALAAFEKLDDQKKLKQVAEILIEEGETSIFLERVIAHSVAERLIQGFEDFHLNYGFDFAPMFYFYETLNAAYVLGPNYDIGVGNAKGGLFSTYIFNLFGLKTVVCKTHRKGKGATFRWCDAVDPSDFEGKKVIVFDKDIVTGRSLRRVVRELSGYNCQKLDLFLNWDPSGMGFGSHLSNVPPEFSQVFYPKKLDYKRFVEMLDTLERRLGI